MSESDKTLRNVVVVGRFPPPIDGQTLATRRLAELLHGRRKIIRVNTEPAGSRVSSRAGLSPVRIRHFMRLRSRLHLELSGIDWPLILWASISPAFLGHFRDFISILPTIPENAYVAAIIHRGEFRNVFTSPITRFTARHLVNQVDQFIFLSSGLSEQCAEWIPPDKRTVIPNTIDDDLIFSNEEVRTARDNRVGSKAFRILFLSNMIPEKGYMDVARAVKLTASVEVKAEFAGAWERDADRTAFESWIREHGLTDRIRVHGPVADRLKVKSLYRNADVLVLPTRMNEAQPLVIIEAMNAGVPVIASETGSIPEIVVDDENGYLISVGTTTDTVDRIQTVVSQLRDKPTWLRLSHGARKCYLDGFSPDAVRAKWMDLLQSAERR